MVYKGLPEDLMRFMFLLFIVAACSGSCYAQPIDGKWTGKYNASIFSSGVDKLVIDLFLHDDSLIAGTSHLYYDGNKYEHYRVNGVYHKSDSTIYFTEDSTIGIKIPLFSTNVLGSYTMKLQVTDDALRFEGKWRENSNGGFGIMNSKVWIEKPLPANPDTALKPVIAKTEDKNLQRPPIVQSLLEIKQSESDSIRIEINDNAQIDGDMVSVYFDDSLVVAKQKIIKEPIVFYVSVSKNNPIRKIIIAAESEGTTPPCTAHMVVTTTQKRYELDLSSDSRKNGTLELFMKE